MTVRDSSDGAYRQLPSSTVHNGRKILLKYHRLLSGSGLNPPNSMSALIELLAGGAEAIEFDVRALVDVDFMLIHDETLDRETTGTGHVRALDSREAKKLRIKGWDDEPALLVEVAEILAHHSAPLKVQVDLKEQLPLTETEAEYFLRRLVPIRSNSNIRLVVGCLADWNLRLLQKLDPTLLLGLDFALYLDAAVDEFPRLPVRENVFGYLDDHPLGYRRAMPVRDYLEDRVMSLCGLVRSPAEIYLRKELIHQMMRDGYNPVEIVRRELGGVVVDGWTLNAGDRDAETHLKSMLEAGVDQITTDTAVQLASLISSYAR